MSPPMLQEADHALVRELNAALATNDASRFHATLDELLATRESAIQSEATRLTMTLQGALARFQRDTRVQTLAGQGIPDARERLHHVVRLTEEAAHRTLELIERSVPLADEIARGAAELASAPATAQAGALNRFLEQARDNCDAVRTNLTEVMLAQGFQDITGQIIQRVHRLIGEVEAVLGDLMHLHDIPHADGSSARRDSATLEGPNVPGVSNGAFRQREIDDLIAGLGL